MSLMRESVLAAVSTLEERAASKLSLLDIASRVMPTWWTPPHLAYLAECLTAALSRTESGENVQLVVSMPPGHGKSSLINHALPCYVLHRHPDWRIGSLSAEASLANRWSREVRRSIQEGLVPGVRVARDISTVTEWETDHSPRGGMIARGIGGAITGRHVRVMIIDDPYKSPAQAASPEYREGLRSYWQGMGSQRRLPPSLTILVMTRWHEEDLAATFAEQGWGVISIPAIAGPGDPLGRAEGAPLRIPALPHESDEEALERLAEVKRVVGSYAWSGQYQQEPAPPKGEVFNVTWWKRWSREREPGVDKVFEPTRYGQDGTRRWLTSWDMAFKGAEDSDRVVGQLWCVIGADRILVDQVIGQWSFTETVHQVKAFCARWPWVAEHLVEDKANGTAVINLLHSEIPGMIGVNPTDSKLARAQAGAPQIEAGNVFVPRAEDAPWVEDFISEHRFFPLGKNDDQVDATSQLLNRVRMHVGVAGRIARPKRALPM